MKVRAIRNGYVYEYDDSINMVDWIEGKGFVKLGKAEEFAHVLVRKTDLKPEANN